MSDLERFFPRLRGSAYRVTSPRDRRYNCIAWAAGDTQRCWWPGAPPDDDGYCWPPGVSEEETVAAFLAAFATLGYVPAMGEELEPGWEKVALFADALGVPTHAARQLADGHWTSKLGRLEDIEHNLRDLEGEDYGRVVQVLKRPAQREPA
jgi:hypothetical protein